MRSFFAYTRRRTRRPFLGAACAVPLLCAALAGCSSGPPKPAGPFARYQRSPAFDAIVRTHAEAADDRDQRLVLTTWFLDGDPRVAMFSGVRPDGHVSNWRYVFEWAVQNSRGSDLVADQLAGLRAALAEMPASQSPTLQNLLIVSFRRGGQWVTQAYDRTEPPDAVVALFSMTGAPIQPAVGP